MRVVTNGNGSGQYVCLLSNTILLARMFLFALAARRRTRTIPARPLLVLVPAERFPKLGYVF